MRFLFLLTALILMSLPGITVLADEPMQVGSTAPNWVLADMSGTPVSLYQEAEAGKTTVMVFFASWCRNCKELLPSLNAMQQHLSGKPYAFYLMNVWEDPDLESIHETEPTNIPLLIRAESVARRFQIETTPGVVVVGPDKKILYKRHSGTSVQETAADLKNILGVADM